MFLHAHFLNNELTFLIFTLIIKSMTFLLYKIEAIKKVSPNLVETEQLPDWNDDKDLLNQILNL